MAGIPPNDRPQDPPDYPVDHAVAAGSAAHAAHAAAPPPPPDDASPDEKELHWFRHVYQGDRVKQLTFRAVLTGGLIGMFMSISNLYTTIKLGWSFGVAITACVLSFVLWNALRAFTGGRLSMMTILETNCMQSTASAAGYTTGTTVGTAFGASLLITGYHAPWYVLLPFVLFAAALGVFVAIPMKRQMINIERLAFPSGIAAAETLRSLYSRGAEALRKAYSLVACLLFGALVAFFRTGEGVIGWIDRLIGTVRIPELVPFPSTWAGIRQNQMTTFGFEPGVLLVGAGMIVGLRVSLSMLAGAILLFCVVTPPLLAHDAAMAGTEDYVPSFDVAPSGAFNPVRWALWGGTSVMVFSSLTAVALQWRTLGRAFRIFKSADAAESPLSNIEVPTSWLVIGLVPITIGLVVINKLAFDMAVWLGLIAVAMSFVVSLVCCRATGETDTTPVGPMGKVTQLLYALLARGNLTVNLMSAATTSAAGAASADLLTDLKSGYLLGANPRRQFLAQFAGVFFGTLAVVPAWYLMIPDAATLEGYNPPATNMWRAVALALTEGLDKVPVTARYAIVIGGLLGVALPVVGRLAPKSAPYLPSAMGLGLSWVVPFWNSLSFAIGAVIAAVWYKLSRRSGETYVVPVASGLIAGESLMAALIAIMATLPGAWESFFGAR